MKNLTWQNPEQLFVAQELINKVKSKCCGIKENGDTPVLFKRKDIITFFRSIDSFFGKPTGSEDVKDIIVDGKINNITDKTLLQKLKPLLNTDTPHTLEAIKVTQQFYGDLPQMKFRDWANLVKNVQFSVSNEEMKCDRK